MFKLRVLYYFLLFRFQRTVLQNKVAYWLKRRWRTNLLKSPFYKSFSTKSLGDFPIIKKSDFMEHFNKINTAGIQKKQAFEVAIQGESDRTFTSEIGDISVGLSTGTSGSRGIFLTDNMERAMWVGAILDRVIGFSFRKRKVAFFLRANNKLYESTSSRLLDFHFFDLAEPLDNLVERLQKLNADLLIGPPSVLVKIAQRYGEQPAHLEKVICVAEVLEKDQKAYLESFFSTTVDQVYQCTEGFLAYTCKKGKLHFNEDFLTIEKNYIDKDKKRFNPIITDYLRKTQPVVRYLLDDIIQEADSCSCGHSATCIEKIEGRQDDIFSFIKNGKEVLIYPDFIRRAITQVSEAIQNYQVTLKGDRKVNFSLDYTDDDPSISADVKNALEQLFKKADLLDVEINETPFDMDHLKKFKRINNENTK
jgi:putative adenylate-forming enzyme